MSVHKDQPAISWGTPVVGVFLWLLNKSLLRAGTTGSRFRIPNMQVAGGGTTKAEAACRAQAGELCLEKTLQDPQEPRVPLTVTCLLCDQGYVRDIF